jgi:hypothetical protein
MNTYLIIFSNDPNNYVKFEASNLQELKNELVNEELMNETEEISNFNWTIFENGTMIQ